MEHCRCNAAHINKIQAERISDTIELPPEHNKMSGISDQEASTNAALDLIEYISNPSPKYLFASIGYEKLEAISRLLDIFKQNTTPHKYPHKDTVQTRVQVKHKKPPRKTKSTMVKLPSNLPNLSTCIKEKSKITPNHTYSSVLRGKLQTTTGGNRSNIWRNLILQYTTSKMAEEWTQKREGYTKCYIQLSPIIFSKKHSTSDTARLSDKNG